MKLDLTVVMPVYNEAGCILEVINDWKQVLNELKIRYVLKVINDGSTDATPVLLETFKNDRCVEVVNKKNSGHGPTILYGYGEAVKDSEWVFQCDSDNEISAHNFKFLWEKREEFHALFGKRVDREQNISRKIISLCSRVVVRLFYGNQVGDVNTPFRLIRSDILKNIIKKIPPNTLAPNVIITGLIIDGGFKIFEHPVKHETRKTGKPSIIRIGLWVFAAKCLYQTLYYRLALSH